MARELYPQCVPFPRPPRPCSFVTHPQQAPQMDRPTRQTRTPTLRLRSRRPDPPKDRFLRQGLLAPRTAHVRPLRTHVVVRPATRIRHASSASRDAHKREFDDCRRVECLVEEVLELEGTHAARVGVGDGQIPRDAGVVRSLLSLEAEEMLIARAFLWSRIYLVGAPNFFGVVWSWVKQWRVPSLPSPPSPPSLTNPPGAIAATGSTRTRSAKSTSSLPLPSPRLSRNTSPSRLSLSSTVDNSSGRLATRDRGWMSRRARL